jgi:hypothetical protein
MNAQRLQPIVLLLTLLLLAACRGDEPEPNLLLPPPTPLQTSLPPAIVAPVDGTIVPLETAVAASSPTPFETPTLIPSPTPGLASSDPQAQTVSPGASLPPTTNDLLFITDGSLKRWGTASRQVTTIIAGGTETAVSGPRAWGQPIPGDVTDFTINQDGRRALVARLMASTPVSDTVTAVTVTIRTYELSYLNLETGGSRVLAPAVNDLSDLSFALSPDGRYAAFGGLSLGEVSPLPLTSEANGQLYVVETEGSAGPRLVDACAGFCRSPLWHQDNIFFVFGDGRGLMLYNITATRPELLISSADGSEFGRSFAPIAWARNGRWLLSQFHSRPGEPLQKAVLDVPTGTIMPIPHTFRSTPLYAELTWMQDDRLFMVRTEQGAALGETWRVNQEAGRVERDEVVTLSTEAIHPTAPVHWPNGRFGYGLLDPNGGPATGLFQRVSFNEPAERVSHIPAATFAPEIAWSPTGSGAAIAHEGRLYYTPTGEGLYDLGTAVGPWAHRLVWVP